MTVRTASKSLPELAVHAAAALFLAVTAALAAIWLWPHAFDLLARQEISGRGGHIAEPVWWSAGLALAAAPFAPAAAATAQFTLAARAASPPGTRCPACGRGHRDLDALARHVRRRHGVSLKELVEPGLACPDCRRSFRDLEALSQHRRDRHTSLA